MKREAPLNEIQGTAILTKDFINRMIRRIENIATNVTTAGTGTGLGVNTAVLTVCKDGEPSEITVFIQN